ncbi:MAG: OB-fold domain-containing protein [Actinomycetes bacterium]
MTSPVRIRSVGVAAPSLRVAAADIAAAWGDRGGKSQLAACADDEDVLTLSWQAATNALDGIDAGSVDALFWGTSRPPYSEGPSYAILATAIGVRMDAGGALLAGSPHSGIEALLAGWDAIAAGSARTALVIAADDVLPGLGSAYERRAGSAAVAYLLSADEGGAALADRLTHTEPVIDRYRGGVEPFTRDVYDARLFREETFLPIAGGVGRALDLETARWSLPDPDGRLGGALAKKVGAGTTVTDHFTELGDTGAAATLIGAALALTEAGTVGVVAYGGGRSTGVAIEVDEPVAGADRIDLTAGSRSAAYTEVLRARGILAATGETVAMGVPPMSAGMQRGAREILALCGAKCVECGVVNTPPSIHPHCLACGADKFTEVLLARTGTVVTYVVNHTMPAPFVAPLPLAVVDLEDGSRVMLQVTGGAPAAEALGIGDNVRLVLRRYAVERGVPVYGYKVERV